MNADLSAWLSELDSDEARVVSLVREAPVVSVTSDFTSRVLAALPPPSRCERFVACVRTHRLFIYSACACLLVVLSCSWGFFCMPRLSSSSELVSLQQRNGTFTTSSAANYLQAFAVVALLHREASPVDSLERAVKALVHAQGADGQWQNVELTRRNLFALKLAQDKGLTWVRASYLKGVRALRGTGHEELTSAEFQQQSHFVQQRLAHACSPTLKHCFQSIQS